MSADVRLENEGKPLTGLADPLYFDSGEHRLFAWLHRSSGTSVAKCGLVVCKPFGYEAICAHRSIRAFSEAAADVGVWTLRFDYVGTGDSSELDPRADQLEAWVRDVICAVAELKRLTGVERIYLLGFRLGALLATLAATRISGISGLILVAPIVNGKRYVRELRITRLAALMGSESSVAGSGADAVAAPKSGDMEISGFKYSAATLAALAQVDLQNPRVPPAANVLVIDGINMPGARAWVDELSGLGVEAAYRTLTGLIEMIMTAPQFATIPMEMVKATCDWLVHLENGRSALAVEGEEREAKARQEPFLASMSLPSDESARHNVVIEHPVLLQSRTALFGIVTEPEEADRPHGAVILVNAGADYHIGANGMNVGLARRWARSGYLVLRMDLAGLGDSGVRSGQPINVVFPAAAVEDIRAAVEWIGSRYAVSDVTLCGVCSGAYHALRAAVSALAVSRIMMVNPETFFWDESMSIHDMQLSEVVKESATAGGKTFSAMAWRRLLSGQIDIRYILRRRARRYLLILESNLRDAARRLRIRLRHDLGSELEEIAARGVRMVFVFSRGEPGIALLKMQGGISIKRLGKHCRIHIIDGADHVFSKFESRMTLENILTDELVAPT